GLQGYSSPSSF
nr:immunoglobulin light chain junction region [Macaca mulatta]